MKTFAEVQQNLTFLNTGQSQTPGVIAMLLKANGGNNGQYRKILVVFNGTTSTATISSPSLQGAIPIAPRPARLNRRSNTPVHLPTILGCGHRARAHHRSFRQRAELKKQRGAVMAAPRSCRLVPIP